jgi:hypothetical protein
VRRRDALGVLAGAPLVAWGVPRRAEAKDYALPEEVLQDIARLEAAVGARLALVQAAVPGAAGFAASVQAVHARHWAARTRLARRLGLSPGRVPTVAADPTLSGLREAQAALMHAHVEGLPALPDASAVDLLARHMVEEARHLAVIDLWIEAEERRA